MIITIDTKTDSATDIRKAIAFLQLCVEDAPYDPSMPSSQPAVDTTSMMSMFDASPTSASAGMSASAQRGSDGSPPDFSSFLNLTKSKSDTGKSTNPRAQIEFY